MRIIITGGSGLIGTELTKVLIQNDHEVIILSRNPENASDLLDGAQAVAWDGKTADGWGELVEETDAIVNLAGESIAGEGFIPSRWTAERKQRIRQSRIDAGKAVVAAVAAANHKPEVVIQASAVGYYGSHGDELIDEDFLSGEDYLASVCVDWENSTTAVEDLGLRRVIVRTGLVFTAQGGIFTRLQLPYKLFVGGPIGSGNQYYSWIHVQDWVAAVRLLIGNKATQGAFNLTTPNPVTNRDFGKTLGKIMGRPSIIPLPGFAMNLALGEVSMTALEGQRVMPKRILDLGFKFKYPELEEALLEIVNQ